MEEKQRNLWELEANGPLVHPETYQFMTLEKIIFLLAGREDTNKRCNVYGKYV